MKLKEIFYMLGFRPKPKAYPYEIVRFDLPKDGEVEYAQWQHPSETEKVIRQETVDELRKFISPGDAVVDIGAHTGDTTLPLALAAGPSGAVLALEPNPFVFPVLQATAALNPEKTNIIPLMFAATPEPGHFTFEYSDPGFCNGGLHAGISRWRHGHAFELEVRGENLQMYMDRHHPELISRIRFLKVDTEGYDHQVLSTLTDVISRQKPYIRAEVFKHLDAAQRERLYDFFTDFGYDVCLVEDDASYLGPALDRNDLEARRHFDVFAVPGGV